MCVQVHYILQEVVMGGMVLETNMNEIVAQVEVQNRMEKSEVSLSATFRDYKGDSASFIPLATACINIPSVSSISLFISNRGLFLIDECGYSLGS